MRIPDEKDDDSTMLNFAESHIVPRARIIYNLLDEHVRLINPMLPTVIKESRIKHANTIKGVDYQAVVAGGFVYVVVEGVITAVGTVSDIAAASAAGGGLVATGEAGLLAAETAAEVAAETVSGTVGNLIKSGVKNIAIAAAGAGATTVGKKIYEIGTEFACDNLNIFNIGEKVGCPKKHVQLKTKRPVLDSGPEQATP